MKTKSILFKSLSCLLFLLPMAAHPVAAAKIIYVDNDGPADFNTIQAAIDNANDGDTALVAPGTYTGEGNRDIDFKGNAITVRSEDGPTTCIIDCQGTEADPHRGFSFNSGEDARSTLQGFTVTNGYTQQDGGAIYCNMSSPSIVNCIISNNKAIRARAKGGGIALVESEAYIISCIVRNNIAQQGDGGGIYISNNGGQNPRVKHCIISGNTAIAHPRFGGEGGGIALFGNGYLVNCVITGNRAGYWGGGISCRMPHHQGFISNSIVWANICPRKSAASQLTMPTCNYDGVFALTVENSIIADSNGNDGIYIMKYNYNCITGSWLTIDPLFIQPGYWDTKDNPDSLFNSRENIWIEGDYHLKSQAGRWDPNSQSWVVDIVTSPCIDAGDPNIPVGDEPEPNGGRINMGAYGGAPQASKSYILSKIIYVDDDAIGLNDGSSWQNAYTFLQDALADAKSSEKPVEIRVAQGIYKPDQGTGQTPGDREATFRLINDVNLTGGYAGYGQYDPNVRDIGLYKTILSGDLDSNDVDVNTPGDLLDEPSRAENSYNIITFSGTYDDTAVLNGFTITAGNANGSSHPLNCGSGMYSRNSKPILNNCTFIGNAARDGGGMYNGNASRPVLTNCTFIGNSARVGGGLLNCYNNSKLTNCTFSDNLAREGGGMFNYHDVITLVENCIFRGNSAEHGGAIGNESSYTKLSNCTFEENRVIDYGGGISFSNSKSTLTNCSFYFNSGENGDALACSSHIYPYEISLTNCILWDDNNEIWNSSGRNSSGITITISYSDIKGGQASVHDPYEKIVWGVGNIYNDPCFVDLANHDYHLKSQGGRYDPNSQSWVQDDVTSPCIDAGDPLTAIGYEPYPNGHRINMGAFGGTQQASMSIYDVNTFKPALVPNPADGSVNVILDIMLSWISDPNAIMHDIYFGTSELPPFIRQQYQREFYPGALEPDTRYYWRIDDIDSLPNRAVGNIWTFLTGSQPTHAYGPSPVNGIDDVVAYRAILTWCPGLNAVKHNVYLGTDFNDVYQATTGNPSGVLVSVAQEPNYFDPGILEFEQTYYWRIDEIVNRGVITTGNIWMFTTGSQPVHAYNPHPPDGAMGVSPNVILSWSPGKDAVSHNVYFGSTYPPPKFVCNQTETEFDPGQLRPQGMLYTQERCHWRIDEIDSQGNITAGDVWKFQVHEYKGRLCFISETPVYINGELVPFSNVTKEQLNSDIGGQNMIEEIQEHEGTFVCYDVLLESGNCITVAENHYFMEESGHWLALHELKAGTRLKTLKGIVGIISVKKRPDPYIGKVYNLKVLGSDRYMVGKDMVIVRDY